MKTIKLLDVNFHYIPSAKTNINATKKNGEELEILPLLMKV